MVNKKSIIAAFPVGTVCIMISDKNEYPCRVVADNLKGSWPILAVYEGKGGTDYPVTFDKYGHNGWAVLKKVPVVRYQFQTFGFFNENTKRSGSYNGRVGGAVFSTLEEAKEVFPVCEQFVKITFEDDEAVNIEIVKHS